MTQPAIDVTEIQRVCHTALWDPPAQGPDQALLADQLRGHMKRLLPELAAIMPRMQGMERRISHRVITTATQILHLSGANLHDLGRECRAMLTLLQKPGPLLDADHGTAARQ